MSSCDEAIPNLAPTMDARARCTSEGKLGRTSFAGYVTTKTTPVTT